MRSRLFVALVLATLGVAAAPGSGMADVHATIGTNTVALPENGATFRLALDGTATRVPPDVSTVAPAMTSPSRRYRVEIGASGVVLIDRRSGARRTLGQLVPTSEVYWSSRDEPAFTVRESGTERLVVFDPTSGARRVVASRVCGLSANPWSPAGDLLAAPVSLAHHGCDGDRRIVVAVANARTGPMRRITRPRTEPIAWARNGKLLVENVDSGVSTIVDPVTGTSRVVLSSYPGLDTVGSWSDGHRFFAILGRFGGLLVLDATLRREVSEFTFGRALGWAHGRQLLALQTRAGVVLFDASADRAIATIPIHARYGFVVTSLSWAPDRRSVTVVASPGLGHD